MTSERGREFQLIVNEALAESRKWTGCKRHQFEGKQQPKLGQKYACRNCGVAKDLGVIGNYIQGYEAGGGNANDIWPGYRG